MDIFNRQIKTTNHYLAKLDGNVLKNTLLIFYQIELIIAFIEVEDFHISMGHKFCCHDQYIGMINIHDDDDDDITL